MVSEAQKALQQDPSNGAALGILAGGYAILGDHERAREWIERAVLIDPDNFNMKYNFACVLASYVGDRDEALNLLESALRGSGEAKVRAAEADPDFDCLRDDPRFRKIMRDAKKRLGLPDEAAPAPAPPAAAAPAKTAAS
jgi:adenylate cyclase